MRAKNGKTNNALKHSIIVTGIVTFMTVKSLHGQGSKVYVPFLDKESQSNINVLVWGEVPCPASMTNTLANTNLFSQEERNFINDTFTKYRVIATNRWPTGSVLSALYATNYTTKVGNRNFTNENWWASFRYTNSDAHEEIRFGKSISASFRTKSNDGYNVSFSQTDSGTILNFSEIRRGLPNGLFVRFVNIRAPKLDNHKFTDFADGRLVEYRRQTNGMVIGEFLMWNPQNRNLMLWAKVKEPYAWESHRLDLRTTTPQNLEANQEK